MNSAAADDELEATEEARAAPRWSWVFWLLLLTAATPLVLSVAAVQRIVGDPQFILDNSGTLAEAPVFADRWYLLLSYDPLSWPTTLSAFAVLALAGAAHGRRPHWLVVPRQRLVVGSLAALCLLWALATTAISVWVELHGTTARQLAEQQQGSRPESLVQWVPAGGLTLFAGFVALAALLVCCVRDSGGPRGTVRTVRD